HPIALLLPPIPVGPPLHTAPHIPVASVANISRTYRSLNQSLNPSLNRSLNQSLNQSLKSVLQPVHPPCRCSYSFDGLRDTLPLALHSVSSASINRFYYHCLRTIDAYNEGLTYGTKEFYSHIYKGHRQVPDKTK
ncbi:hypothetical protein BDZ91DRAFT_683227, partial [Kalaharituber pfeilii]